MELDKTLSALKLSKKGQLKYQKEWGCKTDIQFLLEECTSPPRLSMSITQHIHNMTLRETGLQATDKQNKSANTTKNNSSTHDAENEASQIQRQTPIKIKVKQWGSRNDSTDKAGVSSRKNSKNTRKATDTTESLNQEPTRRKETDKSYALSPDASQIEVAIKQVEDELRDKAEQNLKLRRERMEQQTHLFQQLARTQMQEFEENQELKAMRMEESIEDNILANAQQLQEKKEKMREKNERHTQMLKEKILKAEAQKKRLEEQERRRKEAVKKQREQLGGIITNMKEVKHKTNELYAKCNHKNHLVANFQRYLEHLGANLQKAESLLPQANDDRQLESLIKVLTDLEMKQQNIADQAKLIVEQANKKGEEEKKQAEEAAKQAAVQAAATAAAATAAAASAANTANSATAQSRVATAAAVTQAAEGEILCVFPDGYQEYATLIKKQKEVEEAVKVLSSTPELKKLKMDLQKAVNTPVNALANASGARDKLLKLCALLSGNPVEVSGKRVSASSHPAAVPFCLDLLARKLVKQGEEQISSNHEYAFVYAAIAVGVWCEYPVFGDLLKAHFYLKCPYLVPYYKPKEGGQSTEDYFKSLGYIYKDGECEKQDKFLKRMSGIVRLYAAIMVSTPPGGQQRLHPYSLENAWNWFSSILNLEPRPDITASIMYDFLEVTGSHLWDTYRKQFQKLLHLVCIEYLGKIWKVTPKGSGGPVKRLELFLQQCLSTSRIPIAKGTLPPHFWNS